MLEFFAHAGEAHDSALEASSHALAWYVEIPLFLLIVLGTYQLLRLIFKKQSTAYLVLGLILLIIGFGFYRLAPLVSATSITIGIFVTLLTTLVGLGNEVEQEKSKEKK